MAFNPNPIYPTKRWPKAETNTAFQRVFCLDTEMISPAQPTSYIITVITSVNNWLSPPTSAQSNEDDHSLIFYRSDQSVLSE